MLHILKEYKKRIEWTLKGMKDIDPLNCTHRLHLTINARTYRLTLKRFKHVRKKLVKTELLKHFDPFMSYISGLETSSFAKKYGTK